MTFVLHYNILAIFEDCWYFLYSLDHVEVCFSCNWKASIFLHIACSGYHMHLQSLLIVLFYLSKSLSNIFPGWFIIVREVFKSPILIMCLSVIFVLLLHNWQANIFMFIYLAPSQIYFLSLRTHASHYFWNTIFLYCFSSIFPIWCVYNML